MKNKTSKFSDYSPIENQDIQFNPKTTRRIRYGLFGFLGAVAIYGCIDFIIPFTIDTTETIIYNIKAARREKEWQIKKKQLKAAQAQEKKYFFKQCNKYVYNLTRGQMSSGAVCSCAYACATNAKEIKLDSEIVSIDKEKVETCIQICFSTDGYSY